MQCVLNLQNCSTLWKKIQFNLLKKGRHCNMMSRWAHFRLSVQAVAFYVHLCTAANNCSKNSAQCFSLNPTRSLLWPRPKYVQPNEKTKTDIFLSWTYWTTLDLSFTVTYKHCVPQHVRSGVVKCMHGCMGWDAAHWAEVEWGHRGRSSFFGCKLEIREYFITFCILLYRPVSSLSRDARMETYLLSTAAYAWEESNLRTPGVWCT